METTLEEMKRQRGTKRVCLACEQRFYDLSRDPVVCPLCHASFSQIQYAPVVAVPTGRYRSGNSWGAPAKPAGVAIRTEEPAAVADDEDGSAALTASDTDAVLEDEDDDGDMSDLVAPEEGGNTEE
jgi:hypothetical protein